MGHHMQTLRPQRCMFITLHHDHQKAIFISAELTDWRGGPWKTRVRVERQHSAPGGVVRLLTRQDKPVEHCNAALL